MTQSELKNPALKTWIITDGKMGMDAQCIGVAEALQADYELKHVTPRGIWRFLSPWIGPAPKDRVGRESSPFVQPWPVLILATGRLSIPYLRHLRKIIRGQAFTVVLQDPKTGTGTADLIWVPEHDRLRGDNVVTTLTAPHAFTPDRLNKQRSLNSEKFADLPSPRITISLGGPNSIYTFRDDDIKRLAGAISSLAPFAGSFMVTSSRRTPADLMTAVDQATQSLPRMIWDGEGENPYADFLAFADQVIVTADSINLASEACATGQPVYVFEPTGGSAKFKRFHLALRRYGATRRLPALFGQLESWTYVPLDSSVTIANEIVRRMNLEHKLKG